MKKCPKCQNLFTPENSFCLYDGTVLVEEPAPTVAFRPPTEFEQKEEFAVNLPQEKEEVTRVSSNLSVKKGGSFKRSLTILFAGLFIGAGVSLAVALFIMYQPDISFSPTTPKETPQVLSEKHKERNDTRKDSEFQGFINTLNLNIYSDIRSDPIDQLPKYDRLKIEPRTSTKSPWYNITCEHGITGWVHGDHIKWFDGVTPY